MPKNITPVRALFVQYGCDNCQKANLKATGERLPTSPPKYPHHCPACGHRQNLLTMYPFIRHEPL